jgi:hypothetical protein
MYPCVLAQEERTSEEEGAPELWVHVDAGIR